MFYREPLKLLHFEKRHLNNTKHGFAQKKHFIIQKIQIIGT